MARRWVNSSSNQNINFPAKDPRLKDFAQTRYKQLRCLKIILTEEIWRNLYFHVTFTSSDSVFKMRQNSWQLWQLNEWTKYFCAFLINIIATIHAPSSELAQFSGQFLRSVEYLSLDCTICILSIYIKHSVRWSSVCKP